MRPFVILWFALMTAVVPCAPVPGTDETSLSAKEQLMILNDSKVIMLDISIWEM